MKWYKEILKTQNKRIINIIRNQCQLLKQVKESAEFSQLVLLSRSIFYFKMNLYKFWSKHPVVKKSILSSNYIKNDFKLTKKVSQKNLDFFGHCVLLLFFYFSPIVRNFSWCKNFLLLLEFSPIVRIYSCLENSLLLR